MGGRVPEWSSLFLPCTPGEVHHIGLEGWEVINRATSRSQIDARPGAFAGYLVTQKIIFGRYSRASGWGADPR